MTIGGDLILAGEHLRATMFQPEAERLAITFNYRQKGRTDFVEPHRIQHVADRGFAQLSIISKRNDWFINPDTTALEDVLQTLSPLYKSVHMLGFSMGGYGAFRFAKAAGAQYATAISPQFSIHPDTVPFDRRYRRDAGGFDAIAGDLKRVAKPGLQGVIVIDPFRPLDLANAKLIHAVFPRIEIARLGFGGHPATGLLGRAKRAGIIQKTALNAPPRAAPIIDAHRAVRAADATYMRALADKLMKR